MKTKLLAVIVLLLIMECQIPFPKPTRPPLGKILPPPPWGDAGLGKIFPPPPTIDGDF